MPDASLNALVVRLMADFQTVDGQLRLSADDFRRWTKTLRELSPAQREPVAVDLAVLAARFQREAPESTDGAVHGLMFFALELAGCVEAASRLMAAEGLVLSEQAQHMHKAAEAVKTAPKLKAGRERTIDPAILRANLAVIR